MCKVGLPFDPIPSMPLDEHEVMGLQLMSILELLVKQQFGPSAKIRMLIEPSTTAIIRKDLNWLKDHLRSAGAVALERSYFATELMHDRFR